MLAFGTPKWPGDRIAACKTRLVDRWCDINLETSTKRPNGRGTRLFPEPDHDARLIGEYLGSIPLVGFFAAGEVGPSAARTSCTASPRASCCLKLVLCERLILGLGGWGRASARPQLFRGWGLTSFDPSHPNS